MNPVPRSNVHIHDADTLLAPIPAKGRRQDCYVYVISILKAGNYNNKMDFNFTVIKIQINAIKSYHSEQFLTWF